MTTLPSLANCSGVGAEQALTKLTMRKGKETRVAGGYPWVFAGEVYRLPPTELDGELVVVEDHRGRFLGQGVVNSHSNILVRLLTRQRELIDRGFFERRLRQALAFRSRFANLAGHSDEAMRLVHAEADGLPGLIVDRYADFLVVQALSLGMSRRLPMLVELLAGLVKPRGIYERSDVLVRSLEGLEQQSGLLWGELPPDDLIINEGGMRFQVDVIHGQKTGFFLDQRLNRARVRDLARGRVLNTFSYTGGFSVAAALGAATEVISIDISADAVRLGANNASLNGVGERCSWREANAFDALRELEKADERFDMVILDPPAFTKNKSSIPGALRGYKEINLRALRILNPGGVLVTSSCSHHISPAMFTEILASAAADTRKRVRLVASCGASPDHPVMPSAPETDYLKCLFAEVY